MPNFASSSLAWYSWMFIGGSAFGVGAECGRSRRAHKHSAPALANPSPARPVGRAMIDRAAPRSRSAAKPGGSRMRQWPGAGHALESWEKAPGSPVCAADLAVDAFLRRELGALLPAAGWLSEETVDHPERLARGPVLAGRSDRRHARLHPRAPRLGGLGRAGQRRQAADRPARRAGARASCGARPPGRARWRNGRRARREHARGAARRARAADSLPREDRDLTHGRAAQLDRAAHRDGRRRPRRPARHAALGLRMGRRRRRADRARGRARRSATPSASR